MSYITLQGYSPVINFAHMRTTFSFKGNITALFCLLLMSSGYALAGNDKNYTYLALGDSVAFGLDVRLLDPNNPPVPSDFTGYPEIIARIEKITDKTANASCPGETSGSFVAPGVPDYGCHSLGPQGQPPFKTSIGLHTNYPRTQLQFAVSELSTNKHVNLVTLAIGSNDILILLRDCQTQASPETCVNAGLGGVLQTYAGNLTVILTAIRNDAHYSGDIILVHYYSPSPALNGIAQALNATTTAVASGFTGMKFADGFTAFQIASAPFGGDPCAAGLLVPLAPGVCDIHPSRAGQTVLAATVEAVIHSN